MEDSNTAKAGIAAILNEWIAHYLN
jgi:hypothetical protein